MPNVFIWNKRYFKEEVGHLSLELSDGTYVSHWPAEKKKKFGKVNGAKNTYYDDVRMEGRDPDNTLCLPSGMLTEGNIRRWWARYEGHYHVLGNNCAKVVYKALTEGGIQEYAKFHLTLMTEDTVLTPADVYEFARQCKNCYEEGAIVGTIKNAVTPFAWGWWK